MEEHDVTAAPSPTGGLVPLDPWFDAHIRKPDGSIYSRRARQALVKRYRFPVIRIGWARLIDPIAAAECLRRLAMYQDTFPKRGRPRAMEG